MDLKKLLFVCGTIFLITPISGCIESTVTCTLESATEIKSELQMSKGECITVCKNMPNGTWKSDPEPIFMGSMMMYQCNCYKCD